MSERDPDVATGGSVPAGERDPDVATGGKGPVSDAPGADAALEAALDATEAPEGVDAETEAALAASFTATAARFPPLRDRVLARLEGQEPRSRRPERAPAIPPFGRHRGLLFVLYGAAAAALLTAYIGYWQLHRLQRTALAAETRIEVKNLAIVLRSLRAGSPATAPSTASHELALTRLGIRADAFGNAFTFETTRVYSFGPNGRDDKGAADDIVANW